MSEPGKGGGDRLPTLTEVVDLEPLAPGVPRPGHAVQAGEWAAAPAPAATALVEQLAPGLRAELEAELDARLAAQLASRLDLLLASHMQALREALLAEARELLGQALRDVVQRHADAEADGAPGTLPGDPAPPAAAPG